MEGTYPLPEAQRDRFMARLVDGLPAAEAEMEMLERHAASEPLDSLEPVTDAFARPLPDRHRARRLRLRRGQGVRGRAGPGHPIQRGPAAGAPPRAALHLLRACKAHAAMSGRDHVLPDDVQALALPVLAHRLLPSADAPTLPAVAGGRGHHAAGHVPVPRSRATA
jgi:MoxR-like ATPase